MRDPHARPAEAVATALGTDLDGGLSAAEAAARLASVGPNQLAGRQRPPYVAIVARQLADPLVALLVVATAVSAAIGETTEALVIAAIVVLNAILGFVQEAGAERAVLALRRSLERTAAVVRDGAERELPVEEVVPGDLVVLREGDRAPADARLVWSEGLEVDESALTGESLPVYKGSDPVAEAAPLAERSSMVFAGTGITRGRGRAVVVATGTSSELGAIARMTEAAKPPPTPLQRRLGRLSRRLVVFGVALTVLLAGGMVLRGAGAHEAFLVGVAVAVAAVPEGLAAVVTIALAQGAKAMAGRGAIVRRLSAIEALGATTTIATDKTGTLTLNEISVAAIEPAAGREAREALLAGALASSAERVDGGFVGDPVDAAFLRAAVDEGWDPAEAPPRVAEMPFDPARKRLAVRYPDRLVVKGAPEAVLSRCVADPEELGRLEAAGEAWASEGLRVLAVAEGGGEEERALTPLGVVGLRDTIRPTAADALATARRAGIEVLMLTGDHPATAASIAREIGFPETDGKVFARVTPADKIGLVERLQGDGEIVAVTGDGINDAPALRRADVGVAMGLSGTEAAREASDVVLTDDDFATIVAAVREGRRIGDNLRSFVAFLLSANLGEVALFAIAVLAGLGAPMTVVQVLAVNLLTDGLPAVALSRDPVLPDAMRRPPRPLGRLFEREQALALALAGAAVGLAATVAYLVGRSASHEAGQTMAFATIALAELAFVFSVRSPRLAAWRMPRNLWLVASVAASAALVAAALAVEPLRELLGAVPLDGGQLALVAGLALLPALLVEAGKALRRRLR